VVSFIFADLLILPILSIYRKYYGPKVALRLALTFYVAMVLAGYFVELLFGAYDRDTDHPWHRLERGELSLLEARQAIFELGAPEHRIDLFEALGSLRNASVRADMIEVARSTKYVAGLPNSAGDVGGDPGPHTSLGVFLGIKAAVKWALGKDSLSGLHIAMQGAGSVATGVALHACAEGAKLSIADVDQAKAQKLADAAGGKVVSTDDILGLEADVVSPNALGAILTEQSIAALKTPIIAGGANNQLATPEDGERLHARGILYAPDYVINAGGIINVCTEYLNDGDASLVRRRIEGIPVRLEQIWSEGAETGRDPAAVADAMAQRLIGRA